MSLYRLARSLYSGVCRLPFSARAPPSAIEDAKQAYNWVRKHSKKTLGANGQIIIGGDSAGANLVSIISKSGKVKPLAQILIYPVLNLDEEIIRKDWEMTKNYGIFYKVLLYCRQIYLRNGITKEQNKTISPLLATSLKSIPMTYIVIADIDILSGQAELYANKLRDAGVKVVIKSYSHVPHGFIQFAGIFKKAQDSLDEIIQFIVISFNKI